MKDNRIESILRRAFTPAQLNTYIAKYKKHIDYVRIVNRGSIHDAREKFKNLNNSDFKKLIPDSLNEDESIEIRYNNYKKKKKKRTVLLDYKYEEYIINMKK